VRKAQIDRKEARNMILKMLDYMEKNGEVYEEWTFFDNIESASEYYDPSAKECCIRAKFRDGNMVTFGIPNCAYLLNDNGKTIDKIVPYNVEQYGEGDETVYPTLQEAADVAMNND
jgi:hypothetical protein